MAGAADDLPALEAQLARISKEHPGEIVFALVDALIDVACGDNPALRAYKRKALYQGVLQKLGRMGIR